MGSETRMVTTSV